MASQLIQQFVDRAGFKADREFATKELQILEAQYAALKAARVNLQGAAGTQEIAANAAAMAASIKTATEALAAQTTTINTHTAASQKLQVELLELQKRSAELTVEAQKQSAADKEAAKQKKEQSTAAKSLKDAYQKLNDEYKEASKNAKALAVSEGLHSKAAKDAAQEAKRLSDQLKNIDATVGQHQRNVGNYSGALDKLGNSFQSVINRIVAYASVGAVISFFKGTVDEAIGAEKRSCPV